MKSTLKKLFTLLALVVLNVPAFAQFPPDGEDDVPVDSNLIWLAVAGGLVAFYFIMRSRKTVKQ